MASIPVKIRPILFVTILVLTSIAVLKALDESSLTGAEPAIEPVKNVAATPEIDTTPLVSGEYQSRPQQSNVLSAACYSGIESLKDIQAQVWSEAQKGNVIATVIARQTMYGLGEDVLLQDTAQYLPAENNGKTVFTAVEKNWLKIVKEKAAEADGFFLSVLGTLHHKGYGVPKNHNRAVDYWNRAIEAKYFPAYLFLGLAALSESSTDPSRLPDAVTQIKKAWEFDVPEACNVYGELLYDGRGLEKNIDLALAFWRQAAIAGHAGARFNLSKHFLSLAKSRSTQDDNYAKGIRYLAEAAEEGHAKAGMLYTRYDPIEDRIRKMQYTIDELDGLWSTSSGTDGQPIITYPRLVQFRRHVNITFYSSDDCEACEIAREYLTTRSIAFTELNISKNSDAQTALKKITPECTTPTMRIDEYTLTTFSPSAFNRTRDYAARNRILYPESNNNRGVASHDMDAAGRHPLHGRYTPYRNRNHRGRRVERRIQGSYERIIIERGHYNFREVYEK